MEFKVPRKYSRWSGQIEIAQARSSGIVLPLPFLSFRPDHAFAQDAHTYGGTGWAGNEKVCAVITGAAFSVKWPDMDNLEPVGQGFAGLVLRLWNNHNSLLYNRLMIICGERTAWIDECQCN